MKKSNQTLTRRNFIQYTGTISTATFLTPMAVVRSADSKPADVTKSEAANAITKWQAI